jgi:hypothetical protein
MTTANDRRANCRRIRGRTVGAGGLALGLPHAPGIAVGIAVAPRIAVAAGVSVTATVASPISAAIASTVAGKDRCDETKATGACARRRRP